MYRLVLAGFLFFNVLVLGINHPNHEKSDSWITLQNESTGIGIAYKQTADIDWCRTSSTLPYGFDEISSMIEDLANYYEIFDRVTESRVVGDDIVYIRVDMPFPLSDRDYIVKYTTTKD